MTTAAEREMLATQIYRECVTRAYPEAEVTFNHSRCVELLAVCANEALERVCGLITIEGDKLKFGPFSIGHNPKRVQQEHTMLVELVRALKAEG